VPAQRIGEPRQPGVDVLPAPFDQTVGVEHQGGTRLERRHRLGPRHRVGPGVQRRVGGPVEELHPSVVVDQHRRRMPGTAVGDGVPVEVDERRHRGRGLRAVHHVRVAAHHVQRLRRPVRHPGGRAQRAAQLPHDAGRRQTVTHHVAHGHAEAVPAHQVDQVVPVAAHGERAHRGPVAYGDPLVEGRPARGQHRLLQRQRHLPLPRVRLAQPVVELLQLPCAGVQLGLPHPLGTGARAVAHPEQLGDLLDAVHDQDDVPVGPEHRRVHRAPVALLPLAGALGALDVVALHGHGVALTGGQHPVQ
jgi:hypothetical protein